MNSNASASSAALTAASDDDGNLVVSTRFMEQFEIVRPVTGGGDIAPFRNSTGSLDVYTSGTGGAVFRMREQNGSAAGWVQTELGINASQLAPYVISGISPDNPNILGVDSAAVLTLSTFDPGTGRYRQKVSQPADNKRKLRQFLAAVAIDKNVHANVILDNDEVATNFLKPDGTWATKEWVPIKSGPKSPDNARAKRIAMCSNNPVQTSLYAIGMQDEVLFAESSFRFSYFTRLGTLTAIDLTVVEDTEKRLNIIAVDTRRRLWQKRQKKHSATGKIEWDDWTRIDDTTDVVAVRAVVGFNDAVELFAVGADGRLYITRAKDEPNKRTWSTLFPLGNPVPNNVFNVGRNGQGYSEVFSVTRDSRLYRFWQDPVTTQWYDYEIKPQETGEMRSVPAHSVQIQVLDARGVTKPGTELTIRTSALAPLRINGLYYTTSEFVEAKVRSNSAGIVTIERFTNSLSAPSLLVRTPFMTEAEGVIVEPNAALQDKMHLTTTDDVWNARGADGDFLLKGQNRTRENAESIAKIMQQSMSLGYPAGPGTSQRFLSRNQRSTGLRHVALRSGVSPFRLAAAGVREQHWQVDFSSGFPRYVELERHEALALLEQRNAFVTADAAGFLGIDWGDLWNSIKQGVSSVIGGIKDFIVSTIIDPISGLVEKIKVQFQLLIDGVSRFFETVIEFFQQAFDIVEGIWNSIKVFFEDLFKWLGFLFAWGDMKRSAEVIEHTFNTALDFMAAGVKSARDGIDRGLTQFEQDVKKWMDDYIASIGGADLQKVIDATPQPTTIQTEGTAHNPLLNAITERKDQGGQVGPPTNVGGEFDSVLKKLEELANNFQFGSGKEAFDQAIAYFKQVGKDPDNFLTLIYKGLLKVGEAVALWGIAAARGVIVSVFDVVVEVIKATKDLLNEEYEVPFVSQLYRLITGESLTFRPLRIMSYVVAIPGTIVYKLITNQAPFPDNASVEAFRKLFTVDWLEKQSGITPDVQRKLMHGEALARFNAALSTIGRVFAVFFAVTWLLRAWFETSTALSSATGEALPKLFSLIAIITIGLTSFFSTPWLIADGAGGFGCKDKPLNNLRWLLNIVFGPALGFLIFLIKLKAKLGPELREVTLTLWGAANLGMVIAVAAYGVGTFGSTAINILTTLAPQLLRFLCLPSLAEASDGITVAVLIGLIVATYLGIAAYYIDSAINSGDLAAVNDRVLRFAV